MTGQEEHKAVFLRVAIHNQNLVTGSLHKIGDIDNAGTFAASSLIVKNG
jgi:hypothetical protein